MGRISGMEISSSQGLKKPTKTKLFFVFCCHLTNFLMHANFFNKILQKKITANVNDFFMGHVEI